MLPSVPRPLCSCRYARCVPAGGCLSWSLLGVAPQCSSCAAALLACLGTRRCGTQRMLGEVPTLRAAANRSRTSGLLHGCPNAGQGDAGGQGRHQPPWVLCAAAESEVGAVLVLPLHTGLCWPCKLEHNRRTDAIRVGPTQKKRCPSHLPLHMSPPSTVRTQLGGDPRGGGWQADHQQGARHGL